MPIILDGKALAAEIKADVKERAAKLREPPGLAVILVGNNPASQVYVRSKRKDCEDCGIRCWDRTLPSSVPQAELIELIQQLNTLHGVDGILVQLPLPTHLSALLTLQTIYPAKDVDGFTSSNAGLLMLDVPRFVPCTPAGIIRLLQEYDVSISGKHCVIVGRSNIVGKPLAQMMLYDDATVTVCHSRTKDLGAFTRQADILVSAAGVPGLIGADMVKPGAVVVDVSMNRNAEGKLCGDVVFDEVAPIVSHITPVPGGVEVHDEGAVDGECSAICATTAALTVRPYKLPTKIGKTSSALSAYVTY